MHKNTMIFSLGSRAAKNFWWNRWSLAALFSLDFGSGVDSRTQSFFISKERVLHV